MIKNKLLLFVLLLVVTSLSSCGIFGKGCGCPEFGYMKMGKMQHKVCVKPVEKRHNNLPC
jgi:hypothetical protein